MKLITTSLLLAIYFLVPKTTLSQNVNFITFIANPKKDSIKFFYKNKSGEKYNTFENIQKQISGKLVYYPEKQMTTSYGNFGVIIGIVKQ